MAVLLKKCGSGKNMVVVKMFLVKIWFVIKVVVVGKGYCCVKG